MRGSEQHVERKIRLWVVQQERNRLRERQSEPIAAPVDERGEQRGTNLDTTAHDCWRLG
jgi:hypothetical protein